MLWHSSSEHLLENYIKRLDGDGIFLNNYEP